MKLTGKKWKCIDGSPYYVVEVVFEPEDIQEARNVADKKLNYINVHNPGGIRRPPDVIYSRIVAGKLADSAVYELIKRRIQNSHINAQIIEYDQIRTDGFKEVDPYDLALIRDEGKQELIEVRSSFCYRMAPVTNIIKKLSLYGWYTSYNKPIEPPKDWYWQFIYYMRPQDIHNTDLPGHPIFEQQLQNNAMMGYIVGGSDYQRLKQQGSTRSDEDGAFYQAFSPVSKGGLDYYNMMNLMFNLQLSPQNRD